MKEINFLKDFVDFIENPPAENRIRKLEKKLIKIFEICSELEYKQGKETKLTVDGAKIRNEISANFDELGYYNDVMEIRDNIGNTELIIGDAIDDLTDIVKDIKESLTLVKEREILSKIKIDFELHFKNHIINLLRYLNSDI